MAFGRFNKAKSLAEAEKYVMQGKVPAAIQEYQKVLEQEPRDLVILNTVGDLFLRLGKPADALTYFYKLGEAYVKDGFVRNGIAVFKKITRADPTAVDAISRLSDLYTMQGQLNDARTFLNQAVDIYSQRGETAKCVELFEKLLLMDVDNVSLKQRLAGIYEQAGRKEDAAAMFYQAAESFADKANPGDAAKALEKAVHLGLQNADVMVLKARIEIDGGRPSEAIATLNNVPDRDSNKGALNLLYHAYMGTGDLVAAGGVATTIFESFEDFAGLEQVCALMMERGETGEAMAVFEHVAERMIAMRHTEPLVDNLKQVIRHDHENTLARELLCRIHEGMGETGELVDQSELLADVLARHKEYEKARAIYVKLAEIEANNPEHRRRVQQMDHKLGRASEPEELAPSAPAVAEEYLPDFQAPAPTAPPPVKLDPGSQEIVNNAINEAELQVAYKQPSKAAETLRQALQQLPGNIILNQRLVEVCERTEQWAEAAQCCEALAEAFVMAGDGESASHYSELLNRYRGFAATAAPAAADASHAGGVSEFTVPIDAPTMEFPLPDVDAGPAPIVPEVPRMAMDVAAVAAEDQGTREVDLSGEWESLMTVDAQAAAPPPPTTDSADNLAEEVGFYLQTGMVSEASLALEKLRAAAPRDKRLGSLQQQVEQAVMGGAVAEVSPVEVESMTEAEPMAAVEEPAAPAVEVVETHEELTLEEPALQAAPAAHHQAVQAAPNEEELTLDLDTQHEQGGHFDLSLDVEEHPAPVADPFAVSAPSFAATKPPEPAKPMGIQELMGSLDEDLGDFGLKPAATPPPPPPKAATPAPAKPAASKGAGKAAASGGGLADMFAEFKSEMEQDQVVESDVENHYNMGVAFKEMGLYDEAIGEFQKAFQGAAANPSGSSVIPICSLLAHCFMEKKLPDLATKWLTTALKSPGIDREAEMALRYEIGSAQEVAGKNDEALESFMQVYSLNIDYRDVADRIRTLKGG